MLSYASAYGDFTIVDGTHNVTAYDLKLMPFTNVDCLGKNVVSGVLLDVSENTTSISEALALFHLNIPGATLMTDGGSAYPGVASDAAMTHILCSYHFQQDIFSSCGGMGPLADAFKKDAMALIYVSFASVESFDQQAMKHLDTYSQHSSAIICIKKILANKWKVCRTFTGNSI
jgi:hypothetical protein